MMGWLKKLFARGPANAEKSMLGCLVANLLISALIAIIFWLSGATLVAPGN